MSDDLVKFRHSLTTSPLQSSAPPPPPPPLSADAEEFDTSRGSKTASHAERSQKPQQPNGHRAWMKDGSSSTKILAKPANTASLTTPPKPPKPTSSSSNNDNVDDDGEDLVKLVDAVTKDDDDDDSRQQNSSMTSFTSSAHNYSYTGSGAHISPGMGSARGGTSPPPAYGDPPVLPPAQGWSHGGYTPEKHEKLLSTSFEVTSGSDINSSPPPGASPLFPHVADELRRDRRGGSPVLHPPLPPPGTAPPSFEKAMQSMAGNSPVQSTAPPPPPPMTAGSARIPETLIVRNENGVFLLQPIQSNNSPIPPATSPPQGPAPSGSPPSYGAPMHTPPLPPPAYGESPTRGTSPMPPPYALPPPSPSLGSSAEPKEGASGSGLPPPYSLSPSLRPEDALT